MYHDAIVLHVHIRFLGWAFQTNDLRQSQSLFEQIKHSDYEHFMQAMIYYKQWLGQLMDANGNYPSQTSGDPWPSLATWSAQTVLTCRFRWDSWILWTWLPKRDGYSHNHAKVKMFSQYRPNSRIYGHESIPCTPGDHWPNESKWPKSSGWDVHMPLFWVVDIDPQAWIYI